MKKLLQGKVILAAMVLLTVSRAYTVNLVWQNGNYLAHTNQGLLQLVNPSSGSVFMTSDQGGSYQAEIQPTKPPIGLNSGLFSKVGSSPQSSVECQQPFGNPVACATTCASHLMGAGSTYCTGLVDSYYQSTLPKGITSDDYLNENGCLLPSGNTPTSLTQFQKQCPVQYAALVAASQAQCTKGKPCPAPTMDQLQMAKYPVVTLDTIINNSNSEFEIATTTAPLYNTVFNASTQSYTPDPNTIVGAIAAGKLSIFNNVYSLKPSGSITIGSTAYPVNFLTETSGATDNRYIIAPAGAHNPAQNNLAIKRHMADSRITLDPSPTGPGNQTIILFPSPKMQATCQPVIFIGRDKDNTFYALTYLGAYTSTAGQTCCVAEVGTQATMCPTDSLYPQPINSLLPVNMTNSDNTNPNFIAIDQAGRLSVTINCLPNQTLYGYAASISSLKGAWYPGQPDFQNVPAQPVACSS
jgi:hypothetical protein